MTVDEAKKIRGAVYLPVRAFNAYQMWRDYDRSLIERDLGYAAKLKLNALRVFLSYEYWQADRGRLENSLYHLAQTAWGHKIRIMPVLFECNGDEPTESRLSDRDPTTAGCVRSPSTELVNDPTKWFAIEDYVNWFMQRWAHEHRLLALEVINEPQTVLEFKFARTMFARAGRLRRSLPLTFGSKRFEDSRLMQDLGLDLLQLHESAPRTEDGLRASLDLASETQEILARPVLLTEWQRIGGGTTPAYTKAAEIVQSYPLGNFFWSLMLRPGYVAEQRKQLSGVFHENGAVWSLADARAIAGDSGFTAEERASSPEWLQIEE